ncbi:hypothetical protein SPRG_18796 [Saprolegnia parasitica CBS 223.65]|uniref:Uncharacterized protein n=1 Tax=Saprolegnia parasitica (strain CBS 223.65) TaxID=695850 RepID=A0A067CYI1_SAPPC|nr:hypothetical protein SPRG_18796 [Saprolegnia parasitica CBS 223.65]KDO35563.1 hypothetical protein SPRG_18796 [Saprolegnia parasitica CBS 223.65]|eukprot:XP_012194018.1 hypothetical protein SPRG_18796 [Saprolegnia parasitica CBS 223.65]
MALWTSWAVSRASGNTQGVDRRDTTRHRLVTCGPAVGQRPFEPFFRERVVLISSYMHRELLESF